MSFSAIMLFIIGLVLVVVGSDWLVDGASDIARRSGLSEFVIGLTIVGIGTSTPEMVVSFLSAIRGNADMAVGNVIGSNIFNTFLILGITAVILPMEITRTNLRRDIPLNIFATLLLVLLGLKHTITGLDFLSDSLGRIEGALFLAAFAYYLYVSFKDSKADNDGKNAPDAPQKTYKHVITPIILVLAGLFGLIFGGRLFVNGAVCIAQTLGWSDKFIAITILAGGTSLPELATCIVAAVKKKGQLALGNIIGSNISNILLILGGSALIHPLSTEAISGIDLGFLTLASLFILASAFTFGKNRLDRSEGVGMLVLEGIYMWLLISNL